MSSNPNSHSGSFLTRVQGFTPLIDALCQELGFITAAVYGVVWRYCEMRDGECRASLETIGDHLSLNRSTVFRHIKTLCEHEYLLDTTPDVQNRPHVYVNTGKAKIMALVQADVEHDEVVQRKTEVGQRATPEVSEVVQRATEVGHTATEVVQRKTEVVQKAIQGDYEDTIEETIETTTAAVDVAAFPKRTINTSPRPVLARATTLWQEMSGSLTTRDRDNFEDLATEYGDEALLEAIQAAHDHNAPTWAYVRGVLKGKRGETQARDSPKKPLSWYSDLTGEISSGHDKEERTAPTTPQRGGRMRRSGVPADRSQRGPASGRNGA